MSRLSFDERLALLVEVLGIDFDGVPFVAGWDGRGRRGVRLRAKSR